MAIGIRIYLKNYSNWNNMVIGYIPLYGTSQRVSSAAPEDVSQQESVHRGGGTWQTCG